MNPLLEVNGLEVAYHTQKDRLKALYDVSFNISQGEIVGIVGESGCGKSTIASTLLRLLPPNGEITGGQITFGQRDITRLNQDELRQIRGSEIAMIFQDPMTGLNPVFNIETQMADIERAHLDRALAMPELRPKLMEALTMVGIPDVDERLSHYPHQFSGGMRQRIMIAMALLSKPALLIADEPTSALDVTLEVQILELIKQLRQANNTAVLLITHDLGVVAQTCDRVVVMYAGHVVEQGDVASIFENPQHPYTRALLASIPTRRNYAERLATIPGRVPSLSMLPSGCKFADRCLLAQSVCNEVEPRLVNSETTEVRCHIYDSASGYETLTTNPPVMDNSSASNPEKTTPTPHFSNSPLVQVQTVSTYFYDNPNITRQLAILKGNAIRAVDNVSFEVKRGEVIGLVGESGSGKTTLGKTILRLAPLTKGQIFFNGKDISRSKGESLRHLRREMQMIFQDPYSSLSPRLRVSYLLTEPYKIHNIPEDQRYTVSRLLEMVGLSDEQADKFPHELSGGQARRVGIARALALRPSFLVADEPTSGLDVSVAASILNLMKDLARQLELTYLIITHNLNMVGYISHRVAVMYLGNLVEVSETSRLFESPAHPYTLALLSSISEPDLRQRGSKRKLLLASEIPSPKNPPRGCRFHTRCPFVDMRCRVETPILNEIEPGHQVACHFWKRVRGQSL